jgi:hypothetical protein
MESMEVDTKCEAGHRYVHSSLDNIFRYIFFGTKNAVIGTSQGYQITCFFDTFFLGHKNAVIGTLQGDAKNVFLIFRVRDIMSMKKML